MSHETTTPTRFSAVRQYPIDLAAVSIVAVIAYVVVTSYAEGSVLRLLATFPLALFLPGYALVAVLFPAAERTSRQPRTTGGDPAAPHRPSGNVRGIDWLERLGLSFAISLAIVPLVGIALPFTQWGLTTEPIAASLVIITVVFAQVGVVRRLRTPKPERFIGSPLESLSQLRRDESAIATASSIVLVLAVGLAAGALLVGFLAPLSTGGFTELALYGEDDDGELVAGGIDDEIEAGDSVTATVSIDNQEGEETDYSVVIQEQVLEDDSVEERTDLEELETTLDDGTTGTDELTVTPTADEGETVRMSVLLYSDEVPDEPTNDNADEDTYFWVTVE